MTTSELELLIRIFIRQHPLYKIPEGARNQCGLATIALHELLERNNFVSWPLMCRGPRLRENDQAAWHFVVYVDHLKLVLDPTARQFNPQHAPVRVMDLSELDREWLVYSKYNYESDTMRIKHETPSPKNRRRARSR